MANNPQEHAERRNASVTHKRLTSVEVVLGDGELTPPEKLMFLTEWDARHGTSRQEEYGHVADAADLGFADPAPYSSEVPRAMVELFRLHRESLPQPDDGFLSPSVSSEA